MTTWSSNQPHQFVTPARVAPLADYCKTLAQQSAAAARQLAQIAPAQLDVALDHLINRLQDPAAQALLLQANEQDLARASEHQLSVAAIDRLRLNPARLASLVTGVSQLRQQPSPFAQPILQRHQPNGLRLEKVRVPLGVIFFIYESRPNVTIDAAAICLKSANAIILRGGKEALHSNQALVTLLREALAAADLPLAAVNLVETTDRDAVDHFLQMPEYIQLAIPRGGAALIQRVAQQAKMPVLKHYQGNCHLYLDASAVVDQAVAIAVNGKCQRPGVCNAIETLLIHQDAVRFALPAVADALLAHGVELRGCERTQALLPAAKPVTEEDYRTEFLDLILAVRIVTDLNEALAHIAEYGSGHTEAIVSEDPEAIRRFTHEVDAAAVMVNASTRFHDGGQFGLGAEIGISTDKIHARGPCGVEELTSIKWLVHGTGQIRE